MDGQSVMMTIMNKCAQNEVKVKETKFQDVDEMNQEVE